MKKIVMMLMAVAAMAMTFTSCNNDLTLEKAWYGLAPMDKGDQTIPCIVDFSQHGILSMGIQFPDEGETFYQVSKNPCEIVYNEDKTSGVIRDTKEKVVVMEFRNLTKKSVTLSIEGVPVEFKVYKEPFHFEYMGS